MTCAYNTYFVLVWGSVALAVPMAIALFGLSIYWTVPHEHWNATNGTYDGDEQDHPLRYGLGYGGVALLVLWTALMRLHGSRLHVRAGAWPSLGCGDAYPTNEKEAREAVQRIQKRYGRNPEIVGSAWGFFLLRRGPVGPRVYTHRFTGYRRGRWACGTTIADAVKHYEREGRTFSTHPTMDYISLGAWFAMGNHGNGGNHPRTKGSSRTLRDARVLDMDSGKVMTMDYASLRRAFDASPRSHFLLSVAFKEEALVPDIWLQKEGIVVDSEHSAERWLAPDAHLRVMFQGGGRAYAIGARWNPTRKTNFVPERGVDHIDPHCCQRWCIYTQMDTCSVTCGYHEPMTRFNGYTTYANANRWMPLLFPIETIFVVLAGYRNFEIIFLLPYPLTGVTLWPLVRALIKMHNEIGGRSELRYGVNSPDTPVFLDMALTRDFERPFRLLFHQFGVQEVALHPGKFWPGSPFPCQRVSQAKIYGMDTTYALSV